MIARFILAIAMLFGFAFVAPGQAQAVPAHTTVAGHTAETASADALAKVVPSWDCGAYSWDNDSAFRRCSDTCAYSGVYKIRVKLSQYSGGGQVNYQTKDGFEAMVGSGDNNGSRVTWNNTQWDLVWMRMVGGDGCLSPIKYPLIHSHDAGLTYEVALGLGPRGTYDPSQVRRRK